jgi:hypothetical protein
VRDEHDVAAALGRDGTIFVRRRARDPRHVVILAQPTQRGHEAAAAAPFDARAARIAVVGDRTAVRDDDQGPLRQR